MSTFFRYVVIAGIVYAIDMGGFYLLVSMRLDPVVANICVKIIAATSGFFMHRRFTYRIRSSDDALLHAKKYFGLALLYIPISSTVIYLLLIIIPYPVFAKAISDVLLFIFSFWVTSKIAFSTKSIKNIDSQ